MKEKFDGVVRYFRKAAEEVKPTKEDKLQEKTMVRKEIIKAIKEFPKFDKEILGFINRMVDCIYDRDISKEDFLKMSDRQYRDLRQRIEYDTEGLRELKYGKKNASNSVTLSKKEVVRYSNEADGRFQDSMRKLAREIEETYQRKLKFELIGVLFGAPIVALLTFGWGLIPYYLIFRNYWFKGWRTCTQIYKFKRQYKERYNLIKLCLENG